MATWKSWRRNLNFQVNLRWHSLIIIKILFELIRFVVLRGSWSVFETLRIRHQHWWPFTDFWDIHYLVPVFDPRVLSYMPGASHKVFSMSSKQIIVKVTEMFCPFVRGHFDPENSGDLPKVNLSLISNINSLILHPWINNSPSINQ